MSETKESLLVAISGWGTAADRKRSRDAGFDHHLVKPFDIATLESILRARAAAKR
jgi:DNA-binding response OmpR family regulator